MTDNDKKNLKENFVPMTEEAIQKAIKRAGQMKLTEDEVYTISFAQKQPAVPALILR